VRLNRQHPSIKSREDTVLRGDLDDAVVVVQVILVIMAVDLMMS
jgi:hypothetical protein